jgi:hypothetical protein
LTGGYDESETEPAMNGDPRTALPLESSHPQPTASIPALGHGDTIDTLLRHTADPNMSGFVLYGKLRVEASIAADFEKAQRYLAHDPEALKLLDQFVHDPMGHTVHAIDASDPLGDRFQPHGTFDPTHPSQSGGDIYWNPHGALRSNNGTAQSPALALLHEEGHAWEWKTDPRGYLAGVRDKNRRYDTAEEQRNEQGLETRAARLLGEGTRTDHGGFPYAVDGPTSRTPTQPHISYTPEQLEARISNAIANLDYHGYRVPPEPVSVANWDRKAHTGTFVEIDEHTVALHVGRGAYQIFDVDRDLGGHFPDMTRQSGIDAHGRTLATELDRGLATHR